MAKVELNTHAPEFSLPGLDGSSVSLADFFSKKNVLVVFNRGFV